jgi:hypothetical protein
MSFTLRKRLPGTKDLNEQYSAESIKRVLREYRAIPPGPQGDYKFGELTARFLHLGQDDKKAWENEAGTYPQDVQNEIKRHIIYALNHKDADGNDDPRPIKFKFSGGARAVKATYHVRTQTYTIEIVGLPALIPSVLADRRAKSKK